MYKKKNVKIWEVHVAQDGWNKVKSGINAPSTPVKGKKRTYYKVSSKSLQKILEYIVPRLIINIFAMQKNQPRGAKKTVLRRKKAQQNQEVGSSQRNHTRER